MQRQIRITELISKALDPEYFEIINQSDQHKHHAGDDGSGETHYDIKIISKVFQGKNRVARQRIVNNLLKKEFETGLHAIAMTLETT